MGWVLKWSRVVLPWLLYEHDPNNLQELISFTPCEYPKALTLSLLRRCVFERLPHAARIRLQSFTTDRAPCVMQL